MGSNNKQSRLVELGSMIVFTILDIIDSILCIVYSYLDHFLETDTPSPCYCLQDSDSDSDLNPVSKTLYGRNRKPNLLRKLVGFINPNNNNNSKNRILHKSNRNHDFTKCTSCWSDCSCASCVAWIHNDARHLRLHVVVQQPEEKKVIENVIFLHGFMSSSSFWTETIFNHFSDHTKNKYRLFGVDLLGFGKSPKPRDCLYRMEDHLEMIEESIIFPYKLNSFHIVAHSMGSILALALAANYPDFIRSITLIAPPYFPTCDKEEEEASVFILKKVAPKKLWPPIVFGTSLMSWYEHLGRTVCFFICKYHNIWEFLLKLLTCTRELHFLIMDSTKHTHHSAWHTMHNIICGSAKKMEEYLAILHKERLKLIVIHGAEDQIVPVECSYNIKIKIPDADIRIIPNTNHISVVLSQIKDFTQQLELIWM